MGFTSSFERQHNEILEIVSGIDQNLNEEFLFENSDIALGLLNKLTGKLLAHLTMEDKVLYPKLLEHKNEKVRKVTKEFIDEMGSLSEVFKTYVTKWNHSKLIMDNPSDFIFETKTIFDALGKRVEKENTILYPLAL